MSAPRIAVGGVVRTWDAAERTGVNGAYVRSVLAAGGVPIILSPILGPSFAMRALDGTDGLVLTGGEDIHPAWYGAEPSPISIRRIGSGTCSSSRCSPPRASARSRSWASAGASS